MFRHRQPPTNHPLKATVRPVDSVGTVQFCSATGKCGYGVAAVVAPPITSTAPVVSYTPPVTSYTEPATTYVFPPSVTEPAYTYASYPEYYNTPVPQVSVSGTTPTASEPVSTPVDQAMLAEHMQNMGLGPAPVAAAGDTAAPTASDGGSTGPGLDRPPGDTITSPTTDPTVTSGDVPSPGPADSTIAPSETAANDGPADAPAAAPAAAPGDGAAAPGDGGSSGDGSGGE